LPRIPTSTPVPTLSSIEVIAFVRAHLPDNGGCSLPCILRLAPGRTTLEALSYFLAPFGNISEPNFQVDRDAFEDLGGIWIYFPQEGPYITLRLDYYLADAKLEELQLEAQAFGEEYETPKGLTSDLLWDDPHFKALLAYYMLPSILSNYEDPSQILLAAFPTAPDEYPQDYEPFSLVLFYPDQGFLIEYLSPLQRSSDSFIACPLNSHINLVAWDPRDERSLVEAVARKSGDGIHELNTDYFQQLEVATDFTLASFAARFKEPSPQACLRAPRTMWEWWR
jgi:hypothetical protein